MHERAVERHPLLEMRGRHIGWKCAHPHGAKVLRRRTCTELQYFGEGPAGGGPPGRKPQEAEGARWQKAAGGIAVLRENVYLWKNWLSCRSII